MLTPKSVSLHTEMVFSQIMYGGNIASQGRILGELAADAAAGPQRPHRPPPHPRQTPPTQRAPHAAKGRARRKDPNRIVAIHAMIGPLASRAELCCAFEQDAQRINATRNTISGEHLAKAARAVGLWYHEPASRPAAARTRRQADLTRRHTSGPSQMHA